MKKTKKLCSIMSALLVLSMSVNSVAYASSVSSPTGIEVSFSNAGIQENLDAAMQDFTGLSDKEICDLLVHKYGFSQSEVDLLYSVYSARASISTYSGFPSNPSIGQTYGWEVGPITLPTAQDAARIAVINAVAALAVPSFGAVAALITAIAANLPLGETVVITINYTYGYTNDGVLGWTPGYIGIRIV